MKLRILNIALQKQLSAMSTLNDIQHSGQELINTVAKENYNLQLQYKTRN